MKLLIIKNDGFGDFILVKNLIKQINEKNHTIDIVLSNNNEVLAKDLKNINKKFVFETFGPNFSYDKRISNRDKLKLSILKKKKFDLCIVLRRYLNDEQVLILNQLNAKSIILCHEYFSSKSDLKFEYKKLKISNNLINDYDYFYKFLRKIKLIQKKKIISKEKYFSKKYLVLNLSGEKQFKNINNLNKLIEVIKENYSNKIYIIGMTINKNINKKIEIFLRNMNGVINLWSKTNFSTSMKIINNAEHYVGFDTGLSHYASTIGKNSLIILASGGNYKWFPYPDNLNKNISYWTYNTPCAGCNYGGNLNKCFYKVRYCVDNIFTNKTKLGFEFARFIRKENIYLNFSKFNYFISNWTLLDGKKQFLFIKKNGKLRYCKKSFLNFIKILFGWLTFYFSNKINIFNYLNLIFKNILSFFNYFKLR